MIILPSETSVHNNRRAVIVDHRTQVDVRWQDGTYAFICSHAYPPLFVFLMHYVRLCAFSETCDMAATELIPLEDTLDSDFWPEDLVLRKQHDAEQVRALHSFLSFP